LAVVEAPDSSVAGFLQPGDLPEFTFDDPADGFDVGRWPTLPPTEGQDLDAFMQQVVAGVSGLAGTLIRPRWQPEPPNLPDMPATWAAAGITAYRPEGYPVDAHDSEGEGRDDLAQHEEFDLLCSFYGSAAGAAAGRWRHGIYVAQNRELLRHFAIGLVIVSGPTVVPSLIRERWLYRMDVTATFRRQVRLVYPVLNLLSAPVTVVTDPPYTRSIIAG
jgi:hypothetical protein